MTLPAAYSSRCDNGHKIEESSFGVTDRQQTARQSEIRRIIATKKNPEAVTLGVVPSLLPPSLLPGDRRRNCEPPFNWCRERKAVVVSNLLDCCCRSTCPAACVESLRAKTRIQLVLCDCCLWWRFIELQSCRPNFPTVTMEPSERARALALVSLPSSPASLTMEPSERARALALASLPSSPASLTMEPSERARALALASLPSSPASLTMEPSERAR